MPTLPFGGFPFAQSSCGLVSIHVRHANIHQYQIEPFRIAGVAVQCLLATRRRGHDRAEMCQQRAGYLPAGGVVVHQQDAARFGRFGCAPNHGWQHDCFGSLQRNREAEGAAHALNGIHFDMATHQVH